MSEITNNLSEDQLQSFDIDSIKEMIKTFEEKKESFNFDLDDREKLSIDEIQIRDILQKMDSNEKIISGLNQLLNAVEKETTFFSSFTKNVSNFTEDITDSIKETKKKHVTEIAKELMSKGNVPDNETMISVLDKIQYIVTGAEDKKIGLLINKLKNGTEGDPILQLEASHIIGNFTGMVGISIFNKTQELMISKIFNNENGYTDSLLMGYNNEKGNFIMSISDFQSDIKNKPVEDWNSLMLVNYIKQLQSSGKGTINDLLKIFGENKIKELENYWKENPNEALAKKLLDKEIVKQEKDTKVGAFDLEKHQNNQTENGQVSLKFIKENITNFSNLFDDIENNFDLIINELSPIQTYKNNKLNNTDEKLLTAKNLLEDNPKKIKILNKKGFDRYGTGCPQSQHASVLLKHTFDLELTSGLNSLQTSLEGFKAMDGTDAYAFLSEKLDSNNVCDPHTLINMLHNKIKGPNGEVLTTDNIEDIKNQLADIKNMKSNAMIISKLGISLGIGKAASLHESKLILLNEFGIDLNIFQKYKSKEFIVKLINDNEKIPSEEKEDFINSLVQYNKTQINIQTLAKTDSDDIEVMLKLKKEIYEKMHDARTSIYSIIETFEQDEYKEILNNIGVNKEELSVILTDYTKYKKFIEKLNKQKENGILKSKLELEVINIFIGVEDYVKTTDVLQKDSKYDLASSINTFKGYKNINEENKSLGKNINQDKLNNKENNYYSPEIINYKKTEGGYNLIGKNGEIIEGLVISEEEKKLTLGNPEATENLIKFYEFFKDLNLESVWEYRKELIISMGNRNINFVDNDSLSESELIQFGNTLVLSLNNLIENNKELNTKPKLFVTTSLSGVKNELRKFSGAGSILSDEKTHNIEGEDKFASTLRNFGIIGGTYFKINTFREQIK